VTQFVLGSGFGAVLGALALGYFLFRERGKRSDAEMSLARARSSLAEQNAMVTKLGKLVIAKEKRVRELETKLVESADADELVAELNSVFDSVGNGGDRGSDPKAGAGQAN
jgi:hypothetical protein